MLGGFLDGIEVAFADSAAAGAQVSLEVFPGQWRVGERGPARPAAMSFSRR